MKVLVSSVIGLIALFTVTAAFNTRHARFDNPHWVNYPCISGQTITGKIAGLGQGDITIVINGQVSCTNPTDKDPNPWQDFSRVVHATVTKNGTYTLNSNFKACNRNWTVSFQNVTIEVHAGTSANGALLLGPDPVSNCQ